MIGLLSLLSIVLIGGSSYYFSKQKAIADAKEKGVMVFDFLDSARQNFKEKQKPRIEQLIETAQHRDTIPADLVSGFALTRGIWEKFQKNNPDYIFKQATIDPLVPSNKADEADLEIIKNFQANPDNTHLEGMTIRGENSYYYFSQKITVAKGCLRCHGEPEKAPQWQKKLYGTQNGYNWKEGDIASAYIVYVPIQKALDEAKHNTLIIFLLGSAAVLLLMVIVWICLNVYVIRPLARLEQHTTEISLGKNLEKPLQYKTNDEIGLLYRAVDRLRISVGKLLTRMNK